MSPTSNLHRLGVSLEHSEQKAASWHISSSERKTKQNLSIKSSIVGKADDLQKQGMWWLERDTSLVKNTPCFPRELESPGGSRLSATPALRIPDPLLISAGTCTHVHRHTCTQACVYTCTHAHMNTDTCTQVHMYTGTHVHRNTCTQGHMHTGTHVHRNICTQERMYTCTQAHKNTDNMYIGTHVHMYTGTHVHRNTCTHKL